MSFAYQLQEALGSRVVVASLTGQVFLAHFIDTRVDKSHELTDTQTHIFL